MTQMINSLMVSTRQLKNLAWQADLSGLHLLGVYLLGVYLMGVHLTG